jgi:hypothetical protein
MRYTIRLAGETVGYFTLTEPTTGRTTVRLEAAAAAAHWFDLHRHYVAALVAARAAAPGTEDDRRGRSRVDDTLGFLVCDPTGQRVGRVDDFRVLRHVVPTGLMYEAGVVFDRPDASS